MNSHLSTLPAEEADRGGLPATSRHRESPIGGFVRQRLVSGERYGLEFTLALLLGILAACGFWVIADGWQGRGLLNVWDLRTHAGMRAVLTPEIAIWGARISGLGGMAGTLGIAAGLAAVLLLRRRWWGLLGLGFIAFGPGVVLYALKPLFARPRPVEQVLATAGYSFPSGHAFAAVTLWGYVAWLVWRSPRLGRLRAPLVFASVLLILLIGASRLYLGVHWLSDVLGGYFAGLTWLLVWVLIVRHAEWARSGG